MKVFYDIIYFLPINLLFMVILPVYRQIPENLYINYSVSTVFTCGFVFIKHKDRKKRWFYIGTVAVFLVVLFTIIGENRREILYDEYRYLIWIVAISVVSVIIGIIVQKKRLLRLVMAVFVLAQGIDFLVNRRMVPKATFSIMMFIILLCIIEEIQRKWNKSGYSEKNAHVTMTAPIIAVMCVVIWLIPVSDRPYEWQTVKQIYHHISATANQFIGSITHPKEEYGRIGFSKGSSFLGSLNSNNQEVLIVSTENRNAKNIRLVGSICGKFEGNRWVEDDQNYEYPRMMDTFETICAIRKYDKDHWMDYYNSVTIRYENRLYNTRYIFAPYKLYINPQYKENEKYYQEKGSILSKERLRFGDKYILNCYILNYNNQKLIELLDNASEIGTDEWNATIRYEKFQNNEAYSYNEYQKYRKNIYDVYGKPEGLSDNARVIINKICSESSSDYEKMKYLEAYLKSFEYSVNPGKLPDTVTDSSTYLDYFLFTSKKGYCSHFATAFVLMAREMGIPARYVQGYKVHGNAFENIIVTQDCAHSWPEVYFDNIGWISFEPTPGYENNNIWSVHVDREEEEETLYVVNTVSDITVDIIEDLQETTNDIVVAPERDSLPIVVIIIVPIICVICFVLLIKVISYLVLKNKYRKMNCEEKFRYITSENMRLLRKLGYFVNSGETLSEYKMRISENIDGIDISFISKYEELIYADILVDEEYILICEKTYLNLKERIKKNRWSWLKVK